MAKIGSNTGAALRKELSEEDLARLNRLLPWSSFTIDEDGRKLGRPASSIKRNTAQKLPDRRIVELNRRIALSGSTVFEVGCFEGIHTIALSMFGATVTAVDSRIENVAKTLIRAWAFGFSPNVGLCNVDCKDDLSRMPEVDIACHIGVLYHLIDPVTHLDVLLPRVRRAIILDTHFAAEGLDTSVYEVGGQSYRYQRHREGGRNAVFAGMFDHAKWLRLETILDILARHGFGDADVAEIRDERNGKRVLVYAFRKDAKP